MGNERFGHEIHLKERPVGIPSENNFELVKVSVPNLKEDQFLVRNIWMSVDPYMRGRMREAKKLSTIFSVEQTS